jgi:bifunctional non-homologous end joining protein LigD
VIGKPLSSAYHPGQRRDWIKIKNIRYAEVITCGGTPGQGRRADTIGSLLVGVWNGPRLRYAGHVGTGFTQVALADLTRRLQPLRVQTARSVWKFPAQHARGAQWVHPQLVGEVAFIEWTSDQVLRHPSWRGLRADKNPGQVHQKG